MITIFFELALGEDKTGVNVKKMEYELCDEQDLHRGLKHWMGEAVERLQGRKRDQDITGACVMNKMYSMGIGEGLEPPPSLAEYSLQQLIDANHRVRDRNGTKNSDGSESYRMFCDDRLIAALYVAYNYEPEDQHDIDPIVRLDDRALICLAVSARTDEEDG
jgi:hypothetical protein